VHLKGKVNVLVEEGDISFSMIKHCKAETRRNNKQIFS